MAYIQHPALYHPAAPRWPTRYDARYQAHPAIYHPAYYPYPNPYAYTYAYRPQPVVYVPPPVYVQPTCTLPGKTCQTTSGLGDQGTCCGVNNKCITDAHLGSVSLPDGSTRYFGKCRYT